MFEDAEIIDAGIEIPRAPSKEEVPGRSSFTADSPYYTAFCETELRQVAVLSEALKEISSRAKTFGKCGALMAESTRRLSSACRLEKPSPSSSNSDDEGTGETKQEKEERAKAERKEAIGKDMTSVLQLLAEVLDEIASAQVQMCESLEASLVVSLESFADTEMLEVSKLKAEAEACTESAEASFAKYLNGRHADRMGEEPSDSWNKVSEQVTSRLGSSSVNVTSSKLRRNSSNAGDPNLVQASAAANLQLTLEQIRLAQANAELKRFQLMKKLVSIKKRRNFELGENALASLHGIRAYFNNCSDLVQGLAPRLKRIQNNQSVSRGQHDEQQEPWEVREEGLTIGVDAVEKATEKAAAVAESIAQGDQDLAVLQPTSLEQIEERTDIWNLPTMLAECSRYQREPSPGVFVEGWLYKKSSSRMALQQWSRRWFMMDKDGIYYFHSTAEIKKANGGNGYLHTLERVKICDTVLCMVRELKGDGLRFRFEIVTPNQRPLQLQARGPEEYKMWVEGIRLCAQNQLVHGDLSPDALMQGLGKKKKRKNERTPSGGKTLGSMVEPDSSAAGRSVSNGSEGAHSYHEARPTLQSDKEEGVEVGEVQGSTKAPRNPLVQAILDANPVCADCGKPSPDWACINLGVLVCIECSGVHRGLGVHLSKVRSLRMDALSDSEARLLLSLGNDRVNPIWEAGLESQRGWTKPTGDDTRKTKEDWIKSKYQWKGFLEVDSSDERDHHERLEQASRDLYKAASAGNLIGVAEALAHGGSVDWKNPQAEGKTALHACAVSMPPRDDDSQGGGEWLGIECAELLLQNGAKMNALDDNHQGPLDCAVIGGAEREMIEFLSARAQ